ncbi:MAG: RNA methyltransferase [Clostridiales bacterium]|nr:RNA methyltransferase [Clostridiales bacterium]
MITGSSNARVKNIIALQKKPKERKEQELFVVEGKKLVGEAPAGWISEIYVSESYAIKTPDFFENYKEHMSWDGCSVGNAKPQGIKYEILSDGLFEKVSDTQTPQGILALVKMPSYGFSDLYGDSRDLPLCEVHDGGDKARVARELKSPLLLILEDIQDPGNLGTILRTAEGAGVTGIIMSGGTADVFNPKVVRSTMGSIYRVPFIVAEDLAEAICKVKSEGVRLYAAHLKGTADYDEFDYCGPCGFMIGNEANGLKDITGELADGYVRIPMCGRVESLNAAVSAALLSYEAARQRKHGHGR